MAQRDKDVFLLMDKEHQFVQKIHDLFKSMIVEIKCLDQPPFEDIQNMLLLLELYGDKYHHGKEEQILFPAADRKGVIGAQGGPECTLHFGKFLQRNHLQTVQNWADDYPGIPPYTAHPEVQKLIDKNSPLKIPLSEHEVAYYTTQIMKREVQKGCQWNKTGFVKTAELFAQMLQDHIHKEDQCLLVVLKKNFSDQTKAELFEQFEEFNYNNESLLSQANEIFIGLSQRY